MNILAAPAPTPEQIPYLWALGDQPAPRRLGPGTPRWSKLTAAEMVLLLTPEDGPAGWAPWVCDYATHRRWTFWHDFDARKNASGFPDYLFIRERVVWAELKSEYGTVKPSQRTFATRLIGAGAEYHLWRPRHKAAVLEVLR